MNGFSSRWTAAVVAVLLAGVAATGAWAQKKEITVGVALPLTGRFSTEAHDNLKGVQLFIEDVNRQGGVLVKSLGGARLPLRLVQYDDQSDASSSAKLYERLISVDKVDLLLSPWGSGHNFAVSAVTEKHKFPLVTASAASDSIFGRGFKYVFNTTDLATGMPKPLVDFLKAKDVKSVAILYENFLFTSTLNDAFVKGLKDTKIQVVLDEKYPLGAKDFTGVLTKVKALNPDAVVVFNIMPASVYATRQMKEIGLAPRLYYVNIGPMYVQEFIEGLGPASEGVMENGFWSPELPYAGAREFAARYEAKHKKPPSTDAAYAYMAAQVLTQAVEKAGALAPEQVNATLHREEFTSIGGKFKYDERGVNLYTQSFMAQVQQGKRVVVWPPELTKTTPRFPR